MRQRHPNFDKAENKTLAFTCGGIDYYKFGQDGIPMYQERFVRMGDILWRHEQYKITDAVFTEFIELSEGIIKNEQLSATELRIELGAQLKTLRERRKMNFWPEYHYELASVWYFDEYEDPFGYDETYGQEKIKRWLEAPERTEVFFYILSQPLSQFIPYERLSPNVMLNYTREVASLEYLRSLSNLEAAKSNGLPPGVVRSIELLMEHYRLFVNLNDLPSNNTTITSQNG